MLFVLMFYHHLHSNFWLDYIPVPDYDYSVTFLEFTFQFLVRLYTYKLCLCF
ncbi:hypothetical protein HMPREF3037_03262 [Candidatus Stoquefichus sp. KLE1796]|nr:hypothetical protein HMPREF3037_03262 [Candidatus Stoquefichus sp. KLE1796]